MEMGLSWVAEQFGEPIRVLKRAKRPIRTPGENQIAVRVEACAIAMPDLLMTRGDYPVVDKLPLVPAQEAAGTVIAAGPGTRYKPGDRVMGITEGDRGHWEGGLAEYTLLRDSRSLLIPDTWEATDAAAFCVAFSTANGAIGRRVPVSAGQTILVLGASGSTGSATVILGKALGAIVIAVAAGEEKIQYCREIGADYVVDYSSERAVSDQVLELTDGHGVDVMTDPVGGDLATNAVKAMARRGRIALLGFGSGSYIQLDPQDMIIRDYSAIGCSDYVSTPDEDRNSYDSLDALIKRGMLKPPVRKVWSFEDGAQAVQEVRAAPPGKVVVEMR